ncbi:MAG: ABC transporter ATP-binding protein [Erysipelotrichaceae bacterium]|jgi:putative ABC transport system ATP-binding protein|nr:ABC transporter ATP-binding protein [Erysipelotrichaceae bacterium]
METIIKGRGVTKVYGSGDLSVVAVDHTDFEIAKGELVVILGQSGAGKSTLLNLLGGMDVLSSGSLIVDGHDLATFSKKQLTEYRRNKVGFVFQFYNLMPNLTAKENVELATELRQDALVPEEILAYVGLKERMDNFPSQLSGGEQQRVSIARAVAKNADVILCDEPTGALDYETGKEILTLLQKQAHEEGKTVIIVTHNSALADMADHLIRIKNGQIVLDEHNDSPKQVAEIEW